MVDPLYLDYLPSSTTLYHWACIPIKPAPLPTKTLPFHNSQDLDVLRLVHPSMQRYLKLQHCWEVCADGQGREGRYKHCLTAGGNARSKATFQISGNHFPYLGQGNQLSHILWACYFCADQLSHWAETLCFLGFVFLKIILKKILMPIPTLKALHRSGHLFLDLEGEERKLDKNTLPWPFT